MAFNSDLKFFCTGARAELKVDYQKYPWQGDFGRVKEQMCVRGQYKQYLITLKPLKA